MSLRSSFKVNLFVLEFALLIVAPALALAQTAQAPAEPPAVTDPQTSVPSSPKSPKCPKDAPPAGPSAGQDYRTNIAKAFEAMLARTQYSNLSGEGPDRKSEDIVVKIAKQFGPDSSGKTRHKYSVDGDGPNSFDCSGYVHYVLSQAKKLGANVLLGKGSHTSQYSTVGRLIHKVDLDKFKTSSGGSILRKASDLPPLDKLRPGDLLFFGTSTSCSDKKACPNTVGHIGIYIGNGKYMHSTTSDEDPQKDSASKGNPFVEPKIAARPEGALYKDYNGVKISDLSDSYFTPDFYIMTRRVIPETQGSFGEVEGLGKTAFPGGTDSSVSFNSVHGSTLSHPGEKPGHGAYQNRPYGDAVDITPASGYAYAVFDGTATSGGSGRHSYTAIRSNNGRVVAYYYHTINVKTGPVKAGDRIARTGADGIRHIHFELLVDGKSVHGNLVYRANAPEYVRSLWQTMKMVLGLL